MSWLVSKAVMGLCLVSMVLVVIGLATWPRGGVELLALGGSGLCLWMMLQLRIFRVAARQPGRGLVPAWMCDRRFPRTRRIGLVAVYVAAIGSLVLLASWWPTVGGVAGAAGLASMFAVVAVLELVLRPIVLGPVPAEVSNGSEMETSRSSVEK